MSHSVSLSRLPSTSCCQNNLDYVHLFHLIQKPESQRRVCLVISKNQSGLMEEERNAVNRAWQSACSTGSLSLECADRRGSKARKHRQPSLEFCAEF